ncbi:hypothetical protein GGX14DRAFT_597237 [Mycena pura]|uniref:F-box domain-containing protein n=1 Tax=Mycena pura TaxID=153505 RepID=A0AAD6Y129_9AGAR|nr:hypothetical protein GGX14DRAFT_597237 [Mycena pura]
MGIDSGTAHGRVPHLPPELELAIFKLTARFYPEMIHTLILVSKRVCTWIEPLLYKVVKDKRTRSESRVLRMMASKPPEYLQAHVRHLSLCNSFECRDLSRILWTCTEIESLAILIVTVGTYPALLDHDMRHLMRLRHLSLDMMIFAGNDFQVPPVDSEQPPPNLTHLDIRSFGTPTLCPLFSMLSALTHLAFSDIYEPLLVQHALDTCPALQVLVIVWIQFDTWRLRIDQMNSSDPRFCIVLREDGDVWDMEEIWRRAEAVVASKRLYGT